MNVQLDTRRHLPGVSSAGTIIRFVETALVGAWLIESVPARDPRGSFTRTFCMREFAANGLETTFSQQSTSHSAARGTLRGMHYQRIPHAEVKVVSCRKGAIWDVIIDLRSSSPTYRRWQGFELAAKDHRRLYIPAGFAHGFQSLSDDTEVDYLISEFYEPAVATGVRYDDPAFAIEWPLPVSVISEKDRTWPDFAKAPF
jgi:dTDP-4-dehydrorhamnose 3,5-epimerase